jgi:hypothetical protein
MENTGLRNPARLPRALQVTTKEMKRMRTTMFLLLAAVPHAAIWGQGSPRLGANLCGHVIDAATFIDARAQNASHEEAVVMRWLDPKGTAVHSALFMGRCIAKDGDTIDGRVIARVLPNSLAVSQAHGLTAWEAEFFNLPFEASAGGTPHRGVFSENRIVAELDPGKASAPGNASGSEPDFRWNEEQETVAVRSGIALIPAPVRYTYPASTPTNAQGDKPQAPAPAAKPGCAPQQAPKVNIHAPKKASAWACQHLGICADDKPVVVGADSGCPAAPASGQAK